jgi:hypothetical protein
MQVEAEDNQPIVRFQGASFASDWVEMHLVAPLVYRDWFVNC